MKKNIQNSPFEKKEEKNMKEENISYLKKEENEISNIAKAKKRIELFQNEEYIDKVNNLDFDKKDLKEQGILSQIRGLNFEDSSPIQKIKDSEPTPSGIEEYRLGIMKMLDDSGRNYQLKSQYNNNNKSNNNKNKYNFSFYVQNNSLLNYYDNSNIGDTTPVNDNEKLTKPNDFILSSQDNSKNNLTNIENNIDNNSVQENIYNVNNNFNSSLNNNINNNFININQNNKNNVNNNKINNFQNYYPNQNYKNENINLSQNLNLNAYNYYNQNFNPHKKNKEINLSDYYFDNVKTKEKEYYENYNKNMQNFLLPTNPIVNVNVNTGIPNHTLNYYYPQINPNQNFLNMLMINKQMQNQNPIIFSMNENENNQKKKKKNTLNQKSNFSSMSTNELIKNCVEICKEQSGCRLIQKKIEEQPEITSKILNNLFQNILEIVNDSFGNYLIQKLFNYMNKEQFLQFMALIQIDFYQICINSFGTRVIQKLIDYLNLEILLKTFMNIIKNNIREIIIDINGSHIILKLINLNNTFVNQIILKEISDNILPISMHKHGCCVLQKCFEKINNEERKPLINNLLKNCKELISDKCGNYIIQFIISFNDENIMETINNILITDIENFSKQKFSSNVVEKILEKAPDNICKILINSLKEENIILSILFDKFGNYVLQKSLQRADKETQQSILQIIAPHLYKLKYYSFGLKLYSRLIITYSYLGQIVLDKGNINNNPNNINIESNLSENNMQINPFLNNGNFLYNNVFQNQNINNNNNIKGEYILKNMYYQNDMNQ